MEELITLQKYASLHRLTIHNVVKKVMRGELQSIEKEENGKKTVYIIVSNSNEEKPIPAKLSDSIVDSETPIAIDYKKAYEDLNHEYLVLKTKYELLLKESSQ